MTVVSFLSSSLVAQQSNWEIVGDWMVGDRATNAYFAPIETFPERFDELLRLTRRLGFEAIDIWVAQLNPAWATDDHLEVAQRLLSEHGLTVTSMAGGFGETEEELRATCRTAKAIGTDLLGGNLQLLARDRAAAVRVLQEAGVRLGIENHPLEVTPADMLAQIGDGADGHIGTALDTGWWVTNGFNPVRAVHELADWIFHVHLKDVYAPEVPGQHVNAPYDEGAVPLQETVDALAEVGYTGPVGVEYHPFDRDPTEDIGRARELLTGWLAGP